MVIRESFDGTHSERAGGFIDVHTHPFSGSLDKFLVEMDRAKINWCIPLFSKRNPDDVKLKEVRDRISSRLQGELWYNRDRIFEGISSYLASLAEVSNEQVAELSRRYPGRFLPFGSVYVNGSAEGVEEDLKDIERLGLAGVKLLPTLQLFDPETSGNFERICEWCEKKGKVIVYHTGCDPGPFEITEVAEDANPKRLRKVLDHYSPIIILAHFGAYSAYKPGIWFEEALQLVKRFDNLYADTSAVIDFVLRETNINRIRREVGLDRLLFGSDYPVVYGSTINSDINAILSSQFLSEEEKTMILRNNALGLFNSENIAL